MMSLREWYSLVHIYRQPICYKMLGSQNHFEWIKQFTKETLCYHNTANCVTEWIPYSCKPKPCRLLARYYLQPKHWRLMVRYWHCLHKPQYWSLMVEILTLFSYKLNILTLSSWIITHQLCAKILTLSPWTIILHISGIKKHQTEHFSWETPEIYENEDG